MHIITPVREEHNYAIRLAFKITNNEAEYKAILLEQVITKALGATKIEIRTDSQVVLNQVQGEFAIKSNKLRKYLALVKTECSHFKYFQIQQISSVENQKVDKLVCTASG